MRVYLDNAATTQIAPEVIDFMTDLMKSDYANPSSIHHGGRKSRIIIENARKKVSGFLNTSPGNIFFTSGGTEADNMAIRCGILDNKITHAITSSISHKAVIYPLEELKEKNHISLDYIKLDSNGRVDLNHLDTLLKNNDRTFVSIMHANNEIGTIQPVKQIGEICKKNNILFFVDASQSFGKLEIDVKEMKIDLLASTAHKLYGPKGIGLLYISQKDPKVMLEMQMDGGGHEKGYRSGTLPVPLIVGFAKAMEICENRRKFEYHNLGKLRNFLFKGIQIEHPDVILNGSFDSRLSHNLNLSFPLYQ